jgi:heme exporter protein A
VTLLLETVELYCERDERPLVENLNLKVESGYIYQVEGPNGSGKTTLLRVLCGLSSRYRGELLWKGEAMLSERDAFLAELLYIGHSSGVKAALTPRENLLWHAAISGFSGEGANEHVCRAIETVGLYGFEDVPCYALSAGQQRRVSLARLFIGKKSLWILDEPFTAIDKQGVAELEIWIGEFAQRGGAVILTTHHELGISNLVQHVRLGE